MICAGGGASNFTPFSSATMSAQERKSKKPPACDACKARRVLCHPQLNGESCPRCIEKNIICITTPVTRGRPKKGGSGNGETRTAPPSPSPPSQVLSLPSVGPRPGAGLAGHYSSTSSLAAISASGSNPDLSPDFIQHCFDAVKYAPQYAHPLLGPTKTNIRATLAEVDWDLRRVTPQARVLALCIICAGTLVSCHPFVLSSDPSTPAPTSFVDEEFFGVALRPDAGGDSGGWEAKSALHAKVRHCGLRRVPIYRALRDCTLRAAWETGVLLQATNENAASCYFLDMLEQVDFVSTARPWGVAYVSHIRVLAALWHSTGYTATDASEWAGFLMGEALISTRTRSPVLVTANDQLLFCGPEPPTLEAILSSLQKSAQNPSLSLIWTTTRPFMYHVITLARQLSETSIVSILLERIDGAIIGAANKPAAAKGKQVLSRAAARGRDSPPPPAAPPALPPAPAVIDNTSVPGAARATAYALACGFTSLVLSLYRELEHREAADLHGTNGSGSGSGLTALHGHGHVARARDGHGCGARDGPGHSVPPRVHYTPMHWGTVCAWAEFCVEEVEVRGREEIGEEDIRDLETLEQEIRLLTYALDTSASMQLGALLDRIDVQLRRASGEELPSLPISIPETSTLFNDSILGDMNLYGLPAADAWMMDVGGVGVGVGAAGGVGVGLGLGGAGVEMGVGAHGHGHGHYPR
ncbi:hypothetical protein MKEN_01371100 [Mycena kentingensis (nom. inval.)]|nr:hypothetical protein MKEN_01371100 [Mycena kentingensis (nom. inval.)]